MEGTRLDELFRTNERHLSDFFENAPIGLHLIGSDGIILWANQYALDLLGFERREYVGRHIGEFHKDREVIADILTRLLSHETLCNCEARIRCKDGSIKHVLINSNLLRDDDELIYTCCFTRDITRQVKADALLKESEEREARLEQAIIDRKQAEGQVRKHQGELAHVARISMMGEMATGIAHELNQPLAAIRSYSFVANEMIRQTDLNRQEIEDVLNKLGDQVIRAGDIVRRLRQFVKKSDSEWESTDLNALVEDVARFVEPDIRQSDATLKLIFDESAPSVCVDKIQIQQVLVNLIRNAVDAMQAIPTAQRAVTVSARVLHDRQAEVSVSDTGKGLAEHELEQVFNTFFTTKPEGMGMGLPISRSIVEAHGGKLWSKSNVGPGATFRFTIPLENQNLG